MKRIYKISGMHCASCGVIIEKTFKKEPAVKMAEASFGAESVKLDFDESKITAEALSKKIEPLGYSLILPKQHDHDEHGGHGTAMADPHHDHTRMLKEEELGAMKLQVSVLMPLAGVTAISMVLDALRSTGTVSELPEGLMLFFKFALPLMAAYALFIPGKMFLKGVWTFIRHRVANMDTLIGIGTGAAFVYSLVVVLFAEQLKNYINVENIYFDVTIVVIAFIILGKYLEARSKLKTGDAIRQLLQLQAKTAILLVDGKEKEVPIEEVKHGDLIVVKPGGKIPVDGVITDGHSNVDESMISGEPMPVAKKEEDGVISGTLNKQGSFVFKATKVGSETMLAQIVKMVEEAQGSRAPIQNLADKISGVFVPIVMIIAAVSLALWLVVGYQTMPFSQAISFGLMSFVGVLVIACPCALGLATPTAIIVAVGKGAKTGILIKDAATLEKLYKVDTVVVDKTGTITRGKPELVNFINVSRRSDAEVLSIIGSLEKKSEHPIAGAIIESVREKGIELKEAQSFKAIEGQGVSGELDGQKYFVGSPALMKKLGLSPEESKVAEFVEGGATPIFLATEKELLAYAVVADELKDGAVEAVANLHKMGIKVVMLTGDDKRTASFIAKKVGIDDVIAEVLPDQKLEKIKALQDTGKIVAMAGDGVNDAPALAKADVGIAMATGTDVAIESAGITLLHGDIGKLAKAVSLSRVTMRTIKQNLFWAFIYNIVGIPLAAGAFYPILGILLNPIFAGLAMAFSSVSVVSNSLRLKLRKL
ncbi:MAG: cadmium-translocating P-type ATPase [Candidatus Taylorbacteria bacterium]|nr:cadmium-translocating P-type ATPase [Candidatus Taylorbacteria bacterium]